MSSLSLHEVKTREEFDVVVDVVWAAFHEPFRPEFPWLHSVHGHTEPDRQASIQADKDRRRQQHTSNPASHWFYVADDTSGQVIGATEWQLYNENPFPDGPVKLECTWFPEGSETRDFVTNMINQCYYPRMNWMNRPHLSLNEMAVLPYERRRGVGTLLMQWGMRKAEELNVESFIKATNPGRDLYEKFGYTTLMTISVKMHKKDASHTWTRLANEFRPITFDLMWRAAPRPGNATTLRQAMKQ